jgi:hypothetical protein
VNPTAALLWAACRREPSPAEVLAAVDAGADLNEAADIALVQRVSPLLWRALEQAGIAADGERWVDVLQNDFGRCHAQSRLMLPRIGPLALQPLADAGHPALVMKGGALASRYPDPGLRPMDDIDLVLPPEQIKPAVGALGGAGWTPLPERRPHEIDLTHPALPGLPIDLHRDLAFWRSRANRLTSDQLWAARRNTTLYGAPAFDLPPEIEIVMLAAHAAKPFHVFARLLWTVDIAMVVTDAEQRDGVDWDGVGRIAYEARCPTAVAVALAQAQRLGVASPEELRRVSGGRERRAAIAPVLSADWPVMRRDSAIRMSLRYALVDERRAQATLVLSDVIGRQGPAASVKLAAILGGRLIRRSWRIATGRSRAPLEPGREKPRDLVKP